MNFTFLVANIIGQIGWTNLESPGEGSLNLLAGALELEVDSVRGALYWSTRHSVHTATLLGRHHNVLYQEDLYTGRQGHLHRSFKYQYFLVMVQIEIYFLE